MKEQTKDLNIKFQNKAKSTPNKGSNTGKLLLICNGKGTILFAHGDYHILNTGLKGLKHKNLFSFGFSQQSLIKIANQTEGGLLQAPRRCKKFMLQLVKSNARATKILYQKNPGAFLRMLELQCSLTRVKFSTSYMRQRNCQIKRLPLTSLDTKDNEKMFTLVEITEVGSSFYGTTFEDYCLTLDKFEEKIMKEECQDFICLEKDELNEAIVKVEQM